MALTTDEKYRAICARDRRFDGQFIVAVRTTGIYCRPSCPSRTPREENVIFFHVSAAAHEAGYRACKRCLPDAAPGSPEWDLRGDVAGRAMTLIAEGVVEREGVAGLAQRLGYSARHLTRLLTDELGAGPLALARAQRAHTARALLTNTHMPVSEIAFAAGFRSIRQFNDTFREIFNLTPSQLRARGHASNGAAGLIDLSLPFRAPFDSAGTFSWLTHRAITGVEMASTSSYARAIALPGGPAWFSVYTQGTQLRLHARVTDFGDLPLLIARVRRLFDLDADPSAIDDALGRQPELRACIAAIPGIRVPGSIDPHEMLIRAIVGQQITIAAARAALGKLAETLGERVETDHGITLLFPTMEAIAEHGGKVIRGPSARISTIRAAAAALATGDLTLSPSDDALEQRNVLLTRRGIGPWTADYVRMRVTGDPDVFLPGDVAVRAGAVHLGIASTARELNAWSERTSPWRSYLTAHLWRARPTTSKEIGL